MPEIRVSEIVSKQFSYPQQQQQNTQKSLLCFYFKPLKNYSIKMMSKWTLCKCNRAIRSWLLDSYYSNTFHDFAYSAIIWFNVREMRVYVHSRTKQKISTILSNPCLPFFDLHLMNFLAHRWHTVA